MNTFHFTMLRPDEQVFDGEVAKLFVSEPERVVEILPGHIPMMMNLVTFMGTLELANGSTRKFATSGAMLNVRRDGVTLTSHFIAWENELAQAIAKRQASIDRENKRRRQSFIEYKLTKMELAKMFTDLSNLSDGYEKNADKYLE